MPLDKQAELWLKGLAESGLPPLETMPVPEARQVYAAACAEHGLAPETVADISERVIPGPGGDLPVRIYTPAGSRPLPVLVYFHGGGWVLGGPGVVDGPCTLLANRAHAVVVSVDYRLAPEHPFPAAVEDAWAAVRWVADNAALLGADPERIAVGGDSAGATLATAVAHLARDAAAPALRCQVLLYPVTDAAERSASYRENGEGFFLTADLMGWFLDQYLPEGVDRTDPRVSPLRAADHTGLAPALVVTAEYDPLRDEGEAYGARLAAAGTTVTATRYAGQIHGFAANLAGAMDEGRRALEDAGAQLRQAFRAGWTPRLWLADR
ncbi:MAG TPA: alpha/beta hydrolase [Pseudonocardia sp.]